MCPSYVSQLCAPVRCPSYVPQLCALLVCPNYVPLLCAPVMCLNYVPQLSITKVSLTLHELIIYSTTWSNICAYICMYTYRDFVIVYSHILPVRFLFYLFYL